MVAELEGKITEIEFSKEIDLSSDKIGLCWIKRNKTRDENEKYVSTNNNSSLKKILIPSKKEELTKYLIAQIEKAKDGICMSSFLIQSSDLTDALLRAAERGVKVFILTAREDDLKKANDELTEFEKKENIIEKHKDLLDSFAGKILVRTSPDFHAKYIIIDPHSANPFGLIMTCNATVDAMRGANFEIALSLPQQETQSLFSHFLTGFWMMANHELLEKSKLGAVKKEVDLKIDYGEITFPSTCIGVNSLRDKILELINNASKSLIITAWSFDEEYAVIKAINDAIDRKIKVYIYTRPNARNTNALLPLVSKGANIFGYDRFHAKLIIADGDHGIVTTANFTKLGLDSGFEVSTLLEKQDIDFLKHIYLYWSSLCDWELKNNPSLNDVDDEYKYYDEKNNLWVNVQVLSTLKKELPAISVNSCEEMLMQTEFERYIRNISNNDSTQKAKKIIVTQLLKPAIIPKNVTQEKRNDCPFQVYHGKKKSNKYILVQTWDDIEKAQGYSKKLNAKIVIKGE